MEPPAKKLKTQDESAKSKRQQTFKSEYCQQYDWIKPSTKDKFHAFCKPCNTDFSIARSGAFDITRHHEGKKHKLRLVDFKNQGTISFGSKPKNAEDEEKRKEEEFKEEVTKAELKMINMMLKHNLPFSMMSTMTDIVGSVFHDSKIAQSFASGRTKSTSIVKELASHRQKSLIDRMKAAPFTISTDGSTDQAGEKTFPIVARTVDPDTLRVSSELLALPELHGSATGEFNSFLIFCL